MNTFCRIAPFLVALLGSTAAQAAEPQSVTAKITMVRTGWGADMFAVVTAGTPYKNPAQCQTADGYISDSTQPGYRTFLATALVGFTEKSTAEIVVDGNKCLAGRPVILGINLSK